jgi:transcriptional regulator with XRE-family HTH domain
MAQTWYHPKTGVRTILDGTRLRELREGMGLSLPDVARETRCSVASLSVWENEGACPSPGSIAALRAFYGASLEASGALVVVDV